MSFQCAALVKIIDGQAYSCCCLYGINRALIIMQCIVNDGFIQSIARISEMKRGWRVQVKITICGGEGAAGVDGCMWEGFLLGRLGDLIERCMFFQGVGGRVRRLRISKHISSQCFYSKSDGKMPKRGTVYNKLTWVNPYALWMINLRLVDTCFGLCDLGRQLMFENAMPSAASLFGFEVNRRGSSRRLPSESCLHLKWADCHKILRRAWYIREYNNFSTILIPQ